MIFGEHVIDLQASLQISAFVQQHPGQSWTAFMLLDTETLELARMMRS